MGTFNEEYAMYANPMHSQRNVPLQLQDIAVVSRKTGAVQICVNPRASNKSVLRETDPIPKVDKMLAQLTGLMVFSKLDANSRFSGWTHK